MKNAFAHAAAKLSVKDHINTLLSSFEVKRDLKLICIWEFVFCFGDGLFYFLLPVYMNQLGATPINVGMLYGVHYLSWAITLMIGGFLAERFDQKKIMIAGALLWIPVPLALIVATSWNQLWLPMILYGTYFGSASTCVYVLKSAPPTKTMQTFGLWSASVALGYVVSPTLGGFITSTIGKRATFFMALSLYAVSVLPLVFISRLPKEHKGNQAGLKHSHNSIPRYRRLIILSTFSAMVIFAIFLVKPLIPQFTHGVYNQSIFNVGVFGTAASGGWIFFSFVLGRIGDKGSKMTAALASIVICIFSFLLIALINSFPFLFLASFMSGASFCLIGFMPAIVGSAVLNSNVGRWISASQTSIMIASSGAPIIGGAVYELSPHLPFLIAISLLLVLAVIAIFRKL